MLPQGGRRGKDGGDALPYLLATQTRATLVRVKKPPAVHQNVTLAIPKATLKKAKLMAVEQGTSLSRLLVDYFERLVSADERYHRAHEAHRALLERGWDLGTAGRPTVSREALHERS